MAHRLPLEISTAIAHITNQDNARLLIFPGDPDRTHFLRSVGHVPNR